jgi:hypothetical protein
MKYYLLFFIVISVQFLVSAQAFKRCEVYLSDSSVVKGNVKTQKDGFLSDNDIIFSPANLKLIIKTGAGKVKIPLKKIDSLRQERDMYLPITYKMKLKVGPDRGKTKTYTKLGKRLVKGHISLFQTLELQLGGGFSAGTSGLIPIAGASHTIKYYAQKSDSKSLLLGEARWKLLLQKQVDCPNMKSILDGYKFKDLEMAIERLNKECFSIGQ